MAGHKPGERPPREPYPRPGLPPRRGGLARHEHAHPGDRRPGWLLDGGWPSCDPTRGA